MGDSVDGTYSNECLMVSDKKMEATKNEWNNIYSDNQPFNFERRCRKNSENIWWWMSIVDVTSHIVSTKLLKTRIQTVLFIKTNFLL